MIDTTRRAEVSAAIARAETLEARGNVREAIELLTRANCVARSSALARALVRLRREEGARRLLQIPTVEREPINALPPGDGIFEIEAAELTEPALRAGLARSGCVLVRGLVPADRVQRLVTGTDMAIASYDKAIGGAESVDPGWYDPGTMPDRVADGLPEEARRRFLRERGGLWTADSPHMLFELFALVDDVGVGALMTEFLGERPLLSALKCTLRRVPIDLQDTPAWHQDGAFLGEEVGAFNLWLSLSRCGQDAPGLDILPRRVGRVLSSDDEARFDWSLSDRAVLEAAEGTPIVRPVFEPGDALLFDQLLVHRTAVSSEMTLERYAIESWFFAPSAYPEGQLPILY